MASRISELIVKIGAQTGDFKKALAQTTRELESQASKLTSIGAGFGVGLSAPILGLGAAAVRSFGEIDALKRGLVTVSKSAEEAEKQFADLREVAKLPGLGFKEAVQGAVNLRAVGFSASESSRILGEFGNALAGVGRGKEDLNEVIRQLGQLSSRGKVTADNLKPIIERVPQAAAIIRKEFNTIDTEALQKMGVDSDRFIKVLLDGLSQLPRATGGIKNEFENLKDSVEISLADAGKALEPFASAMLRLVQPAIATIGGLAQSFTQLSPAVQSAVVGLTGLAASIGPLTLLVGQLKNLQSVALGVVAAFAGPQGVLYAIGAGVAVAVAVALPELLRLNSALDEVFEKKQQLEAKSKQKELIDSGIVRTVATDLQGLKKEIEGNEQAFQKFGSAVQQSFIDKGLSFEIVKSVSAADQLKSAFATLRVDGPAKATEEIGKLKTALETVKAAYRAGEVDAAAVTRATKAYAKAVEELTGAKEKSAKVKFFVGDEYASRAQGFFKRLADEVADFTTASFDADAASRVLSRTISVDLNPVVDTLGAKLKTAFRDPISEILKLNAELVTLQANADIANQVLTANSRSPVRNLPLPGTVGTDERMRGAGIDTQGDLRRKADELGDIWQQVDAEVKAGTRSAKDAKRAYDEWTEAEKRAAGVTSERARQSGKAWQGLGRQVSTIVTDLSRGIADVIFEGGKVGEVFQKIGIDIGKSITRYAIEKGVNLLIDSLGKLLGKVIDVGGAFGKVFGGGASAAGGIGSAAGGIGGAIGSGGSAAGTATSALSSAVGLVGAIGSAVTAVFSGLQYLNSRRMEQDIGRIEVTSRSIMNDLANLRADEWSRFNSNFTRFGEMLTAMRSIYEGLSQVNFAAITAPQPVAAGGIVFNGPVTFEVTGATVDDLMADMQRKLKLVSRGFNRG